MDIRKHQVAPTSRLHLLDANDQPMYADDAEGKPDKSKPIVAVLYGHGSKQHAEWMTKVNNRFTQQLKKKGSKSDQTEQELAEEKVEKLLTYTQSIENLSYGDLTGAEALRATFEDPLLGFIGDQIAGHVGEWSNFSRPSTANSNSTSGNQPG